MGELNKVFYSVSVRETDLSRSKIQKLAWATNLSGVRNADVIVLPWHNPEELEAPVFPQGTSDLFKLLAASGLGQVELPVSASDYNEIAMHGKAWRLPTLLLTSVALPFFLNVASNKLSDILPGFKDTDTVHVELIIERPTSSAISIKYEGPANRLSSTLTEESKFLLEESHNPPAPSKGSR